MIKKIILTGLLSLLGTITSLQAQTVQVDLPHFAGKQYSYLTNSGDKKDTITTGKLDSQGKTTLVLPIAKKGYKGMIQLLVNENTPVEFIVNNENFSVSCQEEQITLENVKYTGSAENSFLMNTLQEQKSILEKAGLMQYAIKTYKKEDALYSVFEKEKANVNEQFTTLKSKTAQSPLYAAKFAEIYSFLMGIGNTVDQTEEAKATEANNFVKTKLDFEVLYTSGLWSPTIEGWTQLQQNIIKDDATFLTDTKQILSRIKSNEVYTSFAEKIVSLLAKAGKDDQITTLGQYVSKSGRVVNPGNNLTSAMKGPVKGKVAPALISGKSKKVIKNKTLLLFFESGCNNCENEIHQLLGNYQIIKDKGYEIISVSADMTPNAGDGHSHEFPWKEQFCDYKGFAGINFKNYGVIGTPTFFIIDAKGTITGTYARLIDTKILN